MHIKDINDSTSDNCKELKNEIHEITNRIGYSPQRFIPLMKQAANRARESDTQKDHYMPLKMTSKVYELIDKLMEFSGKDFD